MAATLATAYVAMLPDFRRFAGEMRQGLRRQDPKVDVDVNADTRNLHRTIERDSAKAGRKAGGLFSGGMSTGLAGVAAVAAPVAGALGVIGLGAFKASQKASDLNETISQSRQIFKSSAEGLISWSRTTATSLGLSQTAALGATTQFGDMLTQIGFAPGRAAKMSQGMVTLASDLASFKNADITDVLDAQSAAFRGEYDSLQRFIPNINAARVETEALRITGKKHAEDLTATDKALAIQAIMYRDTKNAQGDFARTSGGMANQQRILKAQLDNTVTSLGQKLLPVAVKVTTWANDSFVPILMRGVNAVGDLGHGVSMLWAAFKTGRTEDEGTKMERLGLFIRGVWEQVQRLVQWWRNDLQPALQLAAERILPSLIDLWHSIAGAFRGSAGDGAKFSGVMSAIGRVITSAIIPILTVLIKKWLWELKVAFEIIGFAIHKVVVPALRGLFRVALDVIGGMLKAADKGLGWIPGIGPKLSKASREFEKFKGQVNAALNGIEDEPVKITATAVIQGDTWRMRNPNGTLGPAMRRLGGAIPGSGLGDHVPVMAEPGEHMWTRQETKAVGGHDAMMRLRGAALRGELAGYRDGGPILQVDTRNVPQRSISKLNSAMGGYLWRWGSMIQRSIFSGYNPSLAGALNFARSQEGKPYGWGSAGPSSYDCSGIQSAMYNIIRGNSPYRHTFATGSFPIAGWIPGSGAFMIGSRRGNPGHMAGTINGVNVESTGSRGVRVGPEARGARNPMFSGVWHLRGYRDGGPISGDLPWDLLDPRGREFVGEKLRRQIDRMDVFDGGGWLPPGGMGVNLSRKPEAVLTQEQLAAVGGTTVILENHGVIGSQSELDQWLADSLTRLRGRGRI